MTPKSHGSDYITFRMHITTECSMVMTFFTHITPIIAEISRKLAHLTDEKFSPVEGPILEYYS